MATVQPQPAQLCPTCGKEVAANSQFCSQCGAAVAAEEGGMTGGYPLHSTVPVPAANASTSSLAGDQGQFAPGIMLARRFRIVSLLGKGGMGEVYRADDLKLGMPVALKLLPAPLAADPQRLELMHNEVRLARQVSHANVCRVFDMDEVEGYQFLSMEYVDGENLASLLRRIGRLPQDKGLQIARQLCAGLAAAHEKGVIHRDLKPANIMLDGRGHVRITDFGLATHDTDEQGRRRYGGTPAYMAPEQHAGREVTIQSDIYSLGLILYELFTGVRVHNERTMSLDSAEAPESSLVHPSALVRDLDPLIDRVILRCLEKDPQARPASAIAVSAALPGGDPLAAALAAGEMPSPEMVAAGGDPGMLKPLVALACLAAVLLGLTTLALLASRATLVGQAYLPRDPGFLEKRAQDLLAGWGYFNADHPPTDWDYGFEINRPFVDHVAKSDATDRWERLRGEAPAIYFWYRQSPQHLAPNTFFHPARPTIRGEIVSWNNPEPRDSEEIGLRLDPRGRLLELRVIPRQRVKPAATTSGPNWTQLFKEQDTGLDLGDATRFTRTASTWTPPVAFDQRAAWVGAHPESSAPIRVEVASYQNAPVYYQVIHEWTRAERDDPSREASPVETFIGWMFAPVLVGAVLLTRRNIQLGRGDRRGAFRLATYIFCVLMLAWLLQASHVPTSSEGSMLAMATAIALYVGTLVWLFYMALEPSVRRIWPEVLISSTRILMGRFRDPRVGRDVLIGALMGVGAALLACVNTLLPTWLGLSDPPWPLFSFSLNTLLGPRYFLGETCYILALSIQNPIYLFMLFLLLRVVLRKQWLASTAAVVLWTVTLSVHSGNPLTTWPIILMGMILVVIVMIRFGLLAMVSFFFVRTLLSEPITLNSTQWYFLPSLGVLGIVAGLAAYGFWAALAGRPLFRDALFETR
jgi:serine/threonine-protein kinase